MTEFVQTLVLMAVPAAALFGIRTANLRLDRSAAARDGRAGLSG